MVGKSGTWLRWKISWSRAGQLAGLQAAAITAAEAVAITAAQAVAAAAVKAARLRVVHPASGAIKCMTLSQAWQ